MGASDYIDFAIQPYQEATLLRALANLLPGGSALDVALTSTRDNLIRKRTNEYFSALAAGKAKLRSQFGTSEAFVHRFLVTSEAVVRESEVEKRTLFANLLLNGPTNDELGEADYKELLQNLDELTMRELLLLKMLDEFEESAAATSTDQNQLQNATAFWGAFQERAQEELGIYEADVSSTLSRIARTGCYKEITGAFFGYAGGMGTTTGLWRKFKRFVLGYD